MKVKIEFFRKCFDCLYETPNTKTLIWDNGDDNNQPDDIELSEEDLGIMLNQLHGFNNIVCENCGNSERLAFAVLKVNNKTYNNLAESNEDSSDEFEIHNEILRLANSSLILFYMKDGSYKIAEVDGVMTSHSDGGKSYTSKVYLESEEIEEIEDFDSENRISYQHIDLSEIKAVEHFSNLENLE